MPIQEPIIAYITWYFQPLLWLLLAILVLASVAYINWVGTIKRDAIGWLAKNIFNNEIESAASADGLFMAVTAFAVMFAGIWLVVAILYLSH